MVQLNHTYYLLLNLWLNRTYYSLLKFTSKIFKIVSFSQIYSELCKIHPIRLKYPAPFINTLCFRYLPRQEILSNSSKLCKFHAVHPHSPRITLNSHQLLTHYTLCFRHLPWQRSLRNSSELRKFCAVHPHGPRIT